MSKKKSKDTEKRVKTTMSNATELTDTNVIVKRKRVDRNAIHLIAQQESRGKEDDLFDLESKDIKTTARSTTAAVSVSVKVASDAMNRAIEKVGNTPEKSSSLIKADTAHQPTWKAAYVHKLAKRKDSATLALAPPKAQVIGVGTRKRNKKFVVGAVTAAMSPSGRVITTVQKNSDESDVDDADDDDDK